MASVVPKQSILHSMLRAHVGDRDHHGLLIVNSDESYVESIGLDEKSTIPDVSSDETGYFQRS